MEKIMRNANVSLKEAEEIYNRCCPNSIEDENVYSNIIQIAILKNNTENIKNLLLAREMCMSGEEGGAFLPYDMKSLLFYSLSYSSMNTLMFILQNMQMGVVKTESLKIPIIDFVYHIEKHDYRGWWNTNNDSDIIKSFFLKFGKNACFCVNDEVSGIYSDNSLVNVMYIFSTTMFESTDEFKRNVVHKFHNKLSKEKLRQLIFR